jgi:hypothetical protein
MEVSRAYSLSYLVPVSATRGHFHFECLHNIQELTSNLPHFFKGFTMYEMFGSPLLIIIVHLPLIIDMQISEVI